MGLACVEVVVQVLLMHGGINNTLASTSLASVITAYASAAE
jgi:hypothetical protein